MDKTPAMSTVAKPRLTIWYGPMMAGKTQSLIRAYNSAPEGSRIAIKSVIDDRYSAHSIVSHDGESIPAVSLIDLRDVETVCASANNVFIDEGQFFPGLADKCESLLALRKNVYVSGLSGDARQRPWMSMAEAVAVADEVHLMTAPECQMCHALPAPFTVLRSATAAANRGITAPLIAVGGAELYAVVCRDCLAITRGK